MTGMKNGEKNIINDGQKGSIWILNNLSIITLCLLFCLGLILTFTNLSSSKFLGSKETGYTFEKGIKGWEAQTWKDSQGCTGVSWSKKGQLLMNMDLIGGHTNKSKGEAWVDMEKCPPAGVKIPCDMENKTITAWVYAPKDSEGMGNSPNGFQVFVKDSNWKNQYGPWHNIEEGKWNEVKMTVSSSTPNGGYMDNGFNPKKIRALGIKMGAGGQSTAKFKGIINVNKITW